MIVRFPDGTVVQATAAGRPEDDPQPDFGLYLDDCWSEFGPGWEYVVVEWPDFGLPIGPAAARSEIRRAFERARAGERIEVGCVGGSGRTGTVLACMAILAGVPADAAVQWVRESYKRSAVETSQQEGFVKSFSGPHDNAT